MTKKNTGRHPRGLSAGQASYLLPSSPRHTEGIRTAGIHKEYGKAVPIFRIPFVNVHLLRKLTNGMTVVFMAFSFLLFFLPAPAHAACSNPAGQNGEMVYNADENVPQVCTNDGWLALGILNSGAGTTGCSNPDGAEGSVVYNTDIHKPQYCNGDDWVEMIGPPVSGGGGGGDGSDLSGPSGCANIGDLCADGTVFAGWDPARYEHLFIPTADQEQPGSPGVYDMDWKNATGTDDISTDSDSDGQVNHANRGGTIGDYPAFQVCEDLTAGGHSDWYLPSRVELYYLWAAHETIEAGGNITNFQSDFYWSSTEANTDSAWYHSFSSGNQYYRDKNLGVRVRCVRR